jgi:hypothetical protein
MALVYEPLVFVTLFLTETIMGMELSIIFKPKGVKFL